MLLSKYKKYGYYVNNVTGISVRERRITSIKDIDPMNINMVIKGRCMSVWHSHKLNEDHDPYSLDCVIQDEEVF